jgi:hypothetical protein
MIDVRMAAINIKTDVDYCVSVAIFGVATKNVLNLKADPKATF